MQEIAVSKFKATCLAVLEDVRKTRRPIRITKFGKPLAEIVPAKAEPKRSWIGCLADQGPVSDDIVGPTGAFDGWTESLRR